MSAVELIGRARELSAIDDVLFRATAGSGGLLVLVGGRGTGKTALVGYACASAKRRGMEVIRVAGVAGRTDALLCAQLLREAGGNEAAVNALLADPSLVQLDMASRALASADQRLIVVDDLAPRGQGVDLVSVLAGRLASSRTAVVATSQTSLGMGSELRLRDLSEAELSEVLPRLSADEVHALWVASGGRPGIALALAPQMHDGESDADPLVTLALNATSSTWFLEVDREMVRWLEAALVRTDEDALRARLMSMLARELIGDASASGRRQALVDEALVLARRSGSPQAIWTALDARLHALWDPAGAEDRLTAAAELISLAVSTQDRPRERQGLFWRFVALMELGRVGEAESTLAAFAAASRRAGDAGGQVMVAARQAMLATLRGRFAAAERLTAEVAAVGRRAGVPDTDMLTATLVGRMRMARGDIPAETDADSLLAAASQTPGHLHEATAARILAAAGALDRARLELDRVLPTALAGSGPRWVGALADLAAAAALVDDRDAAPRLYRALQPFDGRLVVFGGANSCTGPVSHYLGLLARTAGDVDVAIAHLRDAVELEERIGALPSLASTLVELSDALSQRGEDEDAEQAALHAARGHALGRRLGMTGRLGGSGPDGSVWTLARDGDDWLLHAGQERARLRDSRGLRYLRALLASPRQEIRSLDLAAGGPGLVEADLGPVLDQTARAAYKERLRRLGAELDAADAAGDQTAAVRTETERRALIGALQRASGLGPRLRRTSPESERARVNVTRALRAALARIAESAPAAAAHLEASIRTGRACRYEPADGGPQRWQV